MTLDHQYGLLKADDDPRTVEEITRTITARHPVELEEPIKTYDTPLVIQTACPGWQPKHWPPHDAYDSPPLHYEEGGVRYPAIPCTVEDQAEEIIRAAEEGCAAAHIHPRDPADCLATDNIQLLADVYDRIFEQTDVIAMQHAWEITEDGGIDYVGPAKEKLDAGDGTNRYLEGAVVLWPPTDSYPANYTESVREGIQFYYDHGIKPIHKLRGGYHARQLYRDVVEPGYHEEPMVLVHDMGHPFGWPMDSKTWMPVELISSIQQTKERFPEGVVGVFSGNRNWLPVTLIAILMGVDIVRVGIEDFYWMYPHRDDVIQRNIDCIQKITSFCRLIGRDIASPNEARTILGMG